jgi:subtilase family serine protease
MVTPILRRIASRGLFLTLLVFVIVVSVAAPLPLLAQGTQPQDLGPTNAGQTVTASLVIKVEHPDLLEEYVASTQDPKSPSYHRFLSLPSFVFFFAPSSAEFLSSRNT